MHFSTTAFLVATGIGLTVAASYPHSNATFYSNGTEWRSADKPNEIVYLAQCAKVVEGTVAETRDKLFYGTDAISLKTGGKPDAIGTPVDPQGPAADLKHIDWTHGTYAKPISGVVDGREWIVWSLDPSTEIGRATGAGKLDGVDFRCYREDPSAIIAKSSNGFVCNPAYSCTQEVRQIRRTELRLWNQTVDVASGQRYSRSDAANALVDPAPIFANLRSVIDENKGTYTADLSPSCKATFTVRVPEKTSDPNYISDLGRIVANYFVDEVVPIIKRSFSTTEGVTGAAMTGGIPWYNSAYTYPRGGELAVQIANQVNPMWGDQYVFHFDIACEQTCGAPVNQILRAIAATTGALGAIATEAAAKTFFGLVTSGFTMGTSFGKC